MSTLKRKARTWGLIAAAVLGIHALMLLLAHLVIQGAFHPGELWTMAVSRLTEPGDATRYLDIARNGYTATGENAINLVFYPLYPLLIRALSVMTGSLPLSGVLISQISYAAASILLFETILLDGDRRCAWDGVLLMALYPFSMFAMGVFSEGLFLLLSIGCLYALRRQRYIAVGILGFLAALTRTQGVLLLFPAVCDIVSRRLGAEKRKLRGKDALILLIPAGFGVYLFINYRLHGNCLQFLQFEAGAPWYQSTRWIGENIATQFQMALDYSGLDWIIYWPQIILYAAALGVLLWGVRRKERISELVYGGVYLGFTYLSGWMISGGRYLMCCVPMYLILCKVKPGMARGLLFLGSGLLFFAYSLFYLIGYAIM
ncbi:MAG: hypothetical protein IKP32_06895 [Clostridia bacterium]|nr:hypothetical protein [Clostridia bacterium]